MKRKNRGKNRLILIILVAVFLAGAAGTWIALRAGQAFHSHIDTLLPDELQLGFTGAEALEDKIAVLRKNTDMTAILADAARPDMAAFQETNIDIKVTGEFVKLLGESGGSGVEDTVMPYVSERLEAEKTLIIKRLQGEAQTALDGVSAALDRVGCGVDALGEIGQNTECSCILVYGEEMAVYQEQLSGLKLQLQALHDAVPAAVDTAADRYLAELDGNEIQHALKDYTRSTRLPLFLALTGISALGIIMLIVCRARGKHKPDWAQVHKESKDRSC
jgi:hypothetical protein